MIKKLDKEDFLKCFSKSFYDKILKESLLSFKKNVTKTEAKDRIYKVYLKLINFDYSVGTPTEYIYLLKNEYVARIMPDFQIEDEGIYFFLTKQIESDIAINRIPGTFGGWKLGNSIKKEEDDELQYVFNSYNPWLWTKNWKEYQKYIRTNLEKYNYKYALKLDIANFYDSINIEILEKKLYKSCSKHNFDYVELIIYILKYWNKKFNKYGENLVGIPQNEFGDQSRLLANLYLNKYDEKMYEICHDNNCIYTRYADDQVILFDSEEQINNIMYVANNELRKLGLNINTGKTIKFSKKEIINYYLFSPLEKLEMKKYNDAVYEFFDIVDKSNGIKNVRSDTFFKRCLSIGLSNFNNENRNKILSYIMKKEFIIQLNVDFISKIYKNLYREEQFKFVNDLINYFNTVKFNGYHYTIINFLKKYKLNDKYEYCIEKVEGLNVSI